MKKIIIKSVSLLFFSLAFNIYTLAEEKSAFPLGEKLKISADFVGTYRGSLIGQQGSLPYHMCYFSKFYLIGNISPNLYTKLTLFAKNDSLCGDYYEYGKLLYRFYGEYRSVKKNSFQWKIGFGDLGRITLGQGLTFDEIEFEGTKVQLLFKKIIVTLIGLPAGLTGDEDIGIIRLSNSNEYFGLTFVDTLFHFSGNYDDKQWLASIDCRIPFFKYFTLYGEVSGVKNVTVNIPKSEGLGFLAGLNLIYQDNKQSLKLLTELRKYESDFNNFYVGRLGSIYQGQDTEDKKINNWRNYLLFTGDVYGKCFQFVLTKRVYKNLSWLSEIEYLDIIHDNGTKNFSFYKLGFVFSLVPEKLDFYFLVSNKSINNPRYGTNDWLHQDFMFTEHKHYLIQARAKF